MSWFTAGPPRKIFLLSLVGSSIGGIYLLRDTFRGTAFEKDVRCDGKVALITGGNSGIGKETARELARRGAVVFLVCRDKDRCNRARKEIVLSTKNKYVYTRICDLGSLESVKEFVDQFKKEENRLDILINNAGVWKVPYGKTKDGFETHLGINHMGHFLLTNLLLDLMIKSAPSRIINVTSSTHIRGKINKADLNSDHNYSELEAYDQSKLANILFTMELAEKLKGTGVTANAVNPGIVDTKLYRLHNPSLSQNFATTIFGPIKWILYKTPIGGAQTTLYAALDPDLEKVTGKYFSECKEEELQPHVSDDITAKWLWAVSEKWTRLHEFQPKKDKPKLNLS